jgi:hypothetical protein
MISRIKGMGISTLNVLPPEIRCKFNAALYLYENGRCARLYVQSGKCGTAWITLVSREFYKRPFGRSCVENYREVMSDKWELQDKFIDEQVGLACEDLIRKENVNEIAK